MTLLQRSGSNRSWELLESLDQAYRDHVLPPEVTARVALEQATTFGRTPYVGSSGAVIGVEMARKLEGWRQRPSPADGFRGAGAEFLKAMQGEPGAPPFIVEDLGLGA